MLWTVKYQISSVEMHREKASPEKKKKKNLHSDLLNLLLNIELTRSINMAELRKLRRQFISYTKMHPTENTGQIANMFVQYLNKSLH